MILETPEEAIPYIMSGQNTTIIGPAGSRKSQLIETITSFFQNSIIKVAPTGQAALNIGGTTAHKMFGLGLTPFVQGQTDMSCFSKERRAVLASESLMMLIIDEIPMLRIDVLQAIDYRMRQVRQEWDKPFGGIQVLLLGDPYQLPPVVTDRDLQLMMQHYTSQWFFDGEAYNEGNFQHLKLTKTYRQSDPEFIEHLTYLRFGDKKQQVIDYFNDMCYKQPENENILHLCSTNASVDAINKYFINQIDKKSFVFKGKAKGDFKERPVPENIELKVGAKILMCYNDQKERFVNGSSGIITALNKHGAKIELSNGNEVDIGPHTWYNYEAKVNRYTGKIENQIVGQYTQLGVKVGYSCSVHKSQGMTLLEGILDFGDKPLFAEGQLYVALSRFTNLDKVSMKRPLTLRDFKTNMKLKNWYDNI